MDNYTIVRIFLIVLAVATLIILIQKYNSNQSFVDSEGFYADDDFQKMQDELLPMMTSTTSRPSATTYAPTGSPTSPTAVATTYAPQPITTPRLPTPMPDPTSAPFYSSNSGEDEDYQAVSYEDDAVSNAGRSRTPEVQSGQKNPSECFPKDKLTADDLLPKDSANSKWSQVNPAGQGSVKDQNFLQAGYHVGLNTTQGTMKNANLQLRSDPVAPKMLVSPWLNSSYEPDVMRKPLEIGEAC
jgi:hypothetical protein